VRVIWRHGALASARRFMADQAGMRAVYEAVAALAEDPEPPEVFVRGSYRRLRVGVYRVLYEVEDDVIIVVRVDKILT
jgi:mRNA-degrading endonuclease RelE of RelBE toxin-antitoxin system